MGSSFSLCESGIICMFIQIGVRNRRFPVSPTFCSLSGHSERAQRMSMKDRNFCSKGQHRFNPLMLPLSQTPWGISSLSLLSLRCHWPLSERSQDLKTQPLLPLGNIGVGSKCHKDMLLESSTSKSRKNWFLCDLVHPFQFAGMETQVLLSWGHTIG